MIYIYIHVYLHTSIHCIHNNQLCIFIYLYLASCFANSEIFSMSSDSQVSSQSNQVFRGWNDLVNQRRTRSWFQIFLFPSLLGKESNLTNIFQLGWNHQLENVSRLRYCTSLMVSFAFTVHVLHTCRGHIRQGVVGLNGDLFIQLNPWIRKV